MFTKNHAKTDKDKWKKIKSPNLQFLKIVKIICLNNLPKLGNNWHVKSNRSVQRNHQLKWFISFTLEVYRKKCPQKHMTRLTNGNCSNYHKIVWSEHITCISTTVAFFTTKCRNHHKIHNFYFSKTNLVLCPFPDQQRSDSWTAMIIK